MIQLPRSSYLTVPKRNEEICFKDMLTMYLVFGLIDINPNNNINKVGLNILLIILKLNVIFENFLINAIFITFNLR